MDFSKIRQQEKEGGSKNIELKATSFMDGPLDVTYIIIW